METEINRKTIARYLGYRGKPLDEATAKLVEEAVSELSSIVPRHVLLRVPLLINGHTVALGSMTVASGSLAAHLSGCGEAVLLAATLGMQADALIRRASVIHMSRAVVLQACAAAKLEGYLNAMGSALAQDLEQEGLFLTPRFSPGYGDLSLHCQGELLDLLEAGKRIGLGLTAERMLVPVKSVTAVMGLSSKNQTACRQVCEKCPHKACPFREE